MDFKEVTDDQRPPGSSKQTGEALVKLAETAKLDPQELVNQLSDHIAFFTLSLRGLVGHEKTKEFLHLAAENKGVMHIVPQDEMEAMMDRKSVH